MKIMTNRFASSLSVILAAALVLSIGAPLFAADKMAGLSVSISTVTDAAGSVNINVGKGEGIKEGSKGIVTRDGKQIASYVVQQVNWGFSRITLLNVVEGYTVRPGDSAPLSETATEKPSVKKKSSIKSVLTILAIGAAVFLLAGGSGGGGNSSGGSADITVTTQKTSTSSPTNTTGTVTITANVNDDTGFPAPDSTPVTFSTTGGTLNRTQSTTLAGRATATLTYDLSVDPDTVTITVRALGKTASTVLSFLSSIGLVADPLTIEAKDTGTAQSVATITATCVDTSGGSTIQNVTFTTNLGTVANPTAPIGAGGIAATTFSSNTAGTATVTATWGTSKATVIVTVTAGPPFSISVASDTSSIQADGNSSAIIRATVKNLKGNPVTDGTVVNFSVMPDASGGGNGTITPQATTVNGVASTFLYSRDSAGEPSKSGTARIKADVLRANQPPDLPLPVTDLTNQATVVQFVSSQVGEIFLSAEPTNVRGWDIVGRTTTIRAVVYNIDHQPIPDGTAVYFTATHGVISGEVSGNMSRTSDGIATATLRTDASGSGSWNGLVDVTAVSGDITQTAEGLVIFSGAPSASECEATLSQTELTAVGGQASIAVNALDVNGNAVADGTAVTVTTDKGTISGDGNGTTSGGQCNFTLTTSTDTALPTQTGAGIVRVTIASGGAGSPVVITLDFTVVPVP